MGWIKSSDYKSIGQHTALVELHGVIASDSEASADKITSGLQAAFKDRDTKGVILSINSPGGSPVEAGRINDEMQRLRKLYPKIPLYVVVDDICASGGYYVAVAADKIFVDKASIVGSIGVIMDGFGFTGTMEKLGVERRALTASVTCSGRIPRTISLPCHAANPAASEILAGNGNSIACPACSN